MFVAIREPAIAAGDMLYEITSDGCPLAAGKLFTIGQRLSAKTGDTVLAIINGILIVGRWFPDVAGFDWLIQKAKIICCNCAKTVILGRVLAWRSTAAFSIT